MRFMLHYSGPLKTSSGSAEKHRIRKAFHPQLAELWKQEPLCHLNYLHEAGAHSAVDYHSRRPVEPFTFVPLVTKDLKIAAGLSITLLRPGRRGRLILSGGDIDNRLKILFDALTMPQQSNSLPAGSQPERGEDPFFVLLEDDAFITSVTLDTQQLLKPVDDGSHVELFIGVHVSVLSGTMGNTMFG